MAYLGQNFDATTVDPAAPRDLLPPGKYPVQIIESDVKSTQSGGQMLKLTMEVIDGPHKGRRVWDQLNIVNNSKEAQEIAHRTLSAICHAVGVMNLNDSEALHFKPLIASVAVEVDSRDKELQPNDPARRMQNAVKGYSGATGAAVQPRYQPPGQQQRPPAGVQGYQHNVAQPSQQSHQAPAVQQPPQQPPPATRPAAGAPWRRTA